MCALFGWLDYKHIIPYKVLKKLTQALANAAEERALMLPASHTSKMAELQFSNALSPLIKSTSMLPTVQQQLWDTPV